MNKSKKSIYIVIFVLVFIEICTIFLMYKSSNNQGDLFKNVYTLENSPKDMFAILIEQADGTYKKSEETSWKDISSIYAYNSTLSGCVDKNGNKLSGVLSYRNGVATVETKTTTSCYLYFSRDKTAPTISNFYLADGDNTELQYTNKGLLDAIIEWPNTDVDSYCITPIDNANSCNWQKVAGTSIHTRYTLPKYNAENKIYAYLKDEAGNISEPVSDSVIFDTTPPEVVDVVRTRVTKNSITISVNAKDELSGIENYYYKIDNSGYVYSTSATYTFTNLKNVSDAHTISVYVVDKSKQTSEVKTITLPKMNFGEFLMAIQTPGFNSTLQGGMYRYQGTTNDVANYVCFGTDSVSACKTNPELYMYMIIGVVGSADAGMETKINMVKLIKQKPLDKQYPWAASEDYYYWNPNASKIASLLTGINGTYYLTNTGTYKYFSDSSWLNKIADIKWRSDDIIANPDNKGIDDSINQSADTLFGYVNSFKTFTTSKKISLMYIHDYYYAYQSGGLNCSNQSSTLTECKNSWLHLSHQYTDMITETEQKTLIEWTMQRTQNGTYYNAPYTLACAITGRDGHVSCRYYASDVNVYYIRPVFYLTTDVYWSSGTGTHDDPFIIV